MKPELATYLDEIATLVAFVEDRLDARTLEARLHTEAMQALLGLFENPRYPATTNAYRQLTNGRNRETLSGLAMSEDVIVRFLAQAEVPFQPVRPHQARFQQHHDLLSVLPDWLDLPEAFIEQHLLPADETLSASKRKVMAKDKVKQLFRCTKRPPRWIQNPEWPMDGDAPAVFLGQMPIEDTQLFHDTGAAYLFFHPKRGDFETVTQFH